MRGESLLQKIAWWLMDHASTQRLGNWLMDHLQ